MALDATLTPFPADFEIWEVRFNDRMNHPFDLLVRGASKAGNVDLRALLGHRVTLSLPGEALLSAVHGIVRRAARGTPEPSGVTVYDLHVAPAEWALTKRTNSRIFQEQSATEIVEVVLGEHPITTKPAVFTRGLAARDYCVQYDETDYDFASRLLAEEGIATYFDQAAGGVWTLIDDTTLQKPPADDDVTVRANAANLKPGALAVIRWRTEEAVEPVIATRRDYDFQRPQLTVEETAVAPPATLSPAEATLSAYVYEPERLLAADSGSALRTIEAARSRVHVVHLETNFAAAAGASLHIEGDEVSGDWFVVGAQIVLQSSPTEGGGVSTRRDTRLSVIPLSTPYRPELRKRPLVFGTQAARVVGATPEGTVDVDRYGRVNVELRWDRRDLWLRGAPGKENTTRRVRVAQGWAGPGYGLVTLPRVGDEVLVAYEDGNPDRPVVIGRVHNAVSVTPLDLPEANNTMSIWKSQSFGPGGPVDGYNAIAMTDAAGQEVLGVKAQRDWVLLVGRNATTAIGADESTTIGGSQSLTVAGSQTIRVGTRSAGGGGGPGSSSATSDSGDQTVNVKGGYSLGAKRVTLDAKETLDLHSGTDMRLNCDADRSDNSKNHYIWAEGTLYADAPSVTLSGKKILLQSGGSSIEMTDGGIKITSSGPIEINGNPVKLNC